jgi:hypothetical protein
MHFMLRSGSHCQFLEEDLKTSLSRKLTFQATDKIMELARRGNALKTLADKQALEYAFQIGGAASG